MSIEKEREAFENLWLAGGGNFDNFIFSEDQGKYSAIENYNLTDKQKEMALYVVNNAYLFFVGGFKQAAKAQAVPEGFKLVQVTPSDEFIDNLAGVICDEFDTTISGSAHCAREAYKAMMEQSK